jgi:hypothetical protein
MAEVIWAEPALNDLDAIADYISLDNPEAHAGWCRRSSSMLIIFKATLGSAQSHQNSKAGVIVRSSSRRVASSTAKIPGGF